MSATDLTGHEDIEIDALPITPEWLLQALEAARPAQRGAA